MPPGVGNQFITGDLINIAAAWQVLDEFAPELTVVNTFNLDVCHSDFSNYIGFLHRADYGVGWLWSKIQSHPTMANNTVMICMPEHGRNLEPNNLYDANGLRAYDHTGDANSRETFALITGPPGVVNQNQVIAGTGSEGRGEAVDIARYWLEKVDLVAHADDTAGSLSYGARRRLEIARAMCTSPLLLCLDEPAAGLNPHEDMELCELLADIRREHNIAILLIEHDMGIVMRISDHIVVLDHGARIADGTPEEVRANPAVIRAYLGEPDDELAQAEAG